MRHLFTITLLLVFTSTLSPSIYAADTEICRFGVPPWQKGRSFKEERKKYLPLLNWMSKQTGCKFVPVGANSYEDLINKISEGIVQVTELGAIPYIEVKKKNPDVDILATALVWNSAGDKLVDTYHSMIVALKKNEAVNSLQDLKGQKFGFVNRESTSGFVYPSASMKKEAGIDYETFFSKYFFLSSHPNVTDAIVAGSIVAGATYGTNLDAAQKKHGDIFKVLWESKPIPNVLLASHPSLPDSIKEKLIEVLPQANIELFKDISLMKGFVIRPDSFYDEVRAVLEGSE